MYTQSNGIWEDHHVPHTQLELMDLNCDDIIDSIHVDLIWSRTHLGLLACKVSEMHVYSLLQIEHRFFWRTPKYSEKKK